MSLSLFKKPQPAAPEPLTLGPNRFALQTHVGKMSALNAQRLALGEKSGALMVKISARDALRAEIVRRQAAIDAARVAAVVIDAPAPDLSRELAELATREQRLEVVEQGARTASQARAELAAQNNALLLEYKKLQPALRSLVLDALQEDMAALHPALMQAQSAFLKIHREVFLIATAIDQHCVANNLGSFTDAARFEQRFVPLPRCAPFEPVHLSDMERGQREAQRVQQLYADRAQLEREAQSLIGEMLRG
jgi:hypothetical protein